MPLCNLFSRASYTNDFLALVADSYLKIVMYG